MDQATSLFALIRKHSPVQTQTVKYARNDVILPTGIPERYVYHVLSGAVRVVYRSAQESFNIRFGYRGSILSSVPSLLDGSPSPFSIEALRNTRIERLHKQDYLHAVATYPEIQRLHQLTLEALVAQQMEREIDLLTSTPAERLERVLHRSPQLFQEVPLYHIANYLRMTPETLSRLRKS